MKTFIHQKVHPKEVLPKKFIDDGRMEPELIKKIIVNFSNEGDCIFDPFMGYGSFIELTSSLNRRFYGVEIDKDKFEFVYNKYNTFASILMHSDILKVSPNSFPKMHLCITSPTYAWKNVGKNPFTGSANNSYYDEYLGYIVKYFEWIEKFMIKNGYIVLEVSNIEWDGIVTPLAWDIASCINKIKTLKLEKEFIVTWDNDHIGFGGGNYGFGYDHSYLLVYKKTID